MADLTCVYTLTTPGPDISFNNGDLYTTTDLYWIQTLQGLDGSPIRTPIDNAPQTHGGLVHGFWKGPRHVQFEGAILIQSVAIGGDCRAAMNVMEENLRQALDSIIRADGTLAWTPVGMSARSLTVRNDVPLDIQPAENYAIRTFTFGLVAADESW